jgi:chemotaxis signal transduction protein
MPTKPQKKTGPGVRKQFCTFWLSGHLYGVDILHVKEVNPEAAFTPVSHSPAEVKGLVNIRGQIHLILDLRRILGFDTKRVDEKSRLVLFKPVVGESFGILVDRIGDVVEVDEAQIESGRLAEENAAEQRVEGPELISGVCKLQSTLLLIINARDLLKALERQAA